MPRTSRASRILPVLLCGLAAACAGTGRSSVPAVQPLGAAESPGTRALEAGATALQRDAPPDSLDIYLVGFHPMKADPSHQMEAHHFCRQVNEDFAQCALYDGNTAEANLNGIEYIISERLFEQLPLAEKGYWHPHNGEILSGQLAAPGLPATAEMELMRRKMNSYGKTWHVWATDRGDRLPLGDPMLAWSFSRLGEATPGLVENRDRRMGIDTEARAAARRGLAPLARPQSGVDTLQGRFGRPTEPIPGVVGKPEGR